MGFSKLQKKKKEDKKKNQHCRKDQAGEAAQRAKAWPQLTASVQDVEVKSQPQLIPTSRLTVALGTHPLSA